MSKSRAVRRAVAAAGHRDPDALIDALDDLDTSGIDDPAPFAAALALVSADDLDQLDEAAGSDFRPTLFRLSGVKLDARRVRRPGRIALPGLRRLAKATPVELTMLVVSPVEEWVEAQFSARVIDEPQPGETAVVADEVTGRFGPRVAALWATYLAHTDSPAAGELRAWLRAHPAA